MRSYLFSLLFIYFFLLLFCFACECIHTAERVGEAEDVAVFVPKVTHVPLEYGSVPEHQKHVDKFCSPTLVYVDGVLVAFAETHYGTGLKLSADIVARNITIDKTKNNWETQVLVKDSWKTHVAASKNNGTVDGHHAMMNPGAVVTENKNIHVIAGSKKTNMGTQRGGRTRGTEPENWDIELVVGEVNEEKGNKIVKWKAPKSVRTSIMEKLNNLQELKNYEKKTVTGSAGVPTVTSNDGAFVFILKVETGEADTVNVIARSRDDGDTWDKVRVIKKEEGLYPNVVEWENGKLLVMTSNEGYRKVYNLSDDWTTLTETGGMLSRVWGNNKQRSDSGYSNSFIKANISGKNVLLFAQPVETESPKYQLYLWMTNGYRVYNAGPVSAEQNSDFSSVLLYADGMLFLLYYRQNSSITGYFLRPLADALQRVKETLDAWAKQDAALSKLCEECGESVPVQGLVGFFSDGGNTTHWADKYLCVNATVSKATNVTNGFEFKGAGSGARWLVDTKGQNHPYHFANYEFTLVATVVIYEVPKDISPVLSLALDKQRVHERRLALWYDDKRRWSTKYSPDDELKAESWEPGKAYLVALTLKEETGHVYVDKKQLEGDVDMSGLKKSPNVSHLSIGRDEEQHGASYGRMTVTDVFLYNRQLNSSEIGELVRRKEQLTPTLEAPKPTPQSPDVHTGGNSSGGNSTGSGSGGGGNGGGSEHTETGIVSNGTGHAANNTIGGGNESPTLEKDVSERFLNTHVFLALLLFLFVCGRAQFYLF